MSGPFVRSVMEAERQQAGCWEAIYYQRSGWSLAGRNVYMHSRQIALGPEWSELQGIVVRMQMRMRKRKQTH